MSSWKERLYPHLPIPLQNVACTLEGWRERRLRFGGEFRLLLDWLSETEWWSAERIRAYQDEQLALLVRHAQATVPYYRRRFDEVGLKPGDVNGVADLDRLPVVTKEEVRTHWREMVSSDFLPADMVHCHTSGTTGTSLDFYQEPRSIRFRWAVWKRFQRRFGVEWDAPFATFTGKAAVPLDQTRPPFWRENLAMRQTIFTMHHVTPAKVPAIVGRLNRGGYASYSGYPSILYALAGMMQGQGLAIAASPLAVFTGAENLYADQRQAIAAVTGARVTDQYGFSEGCGNASRCGEDLFHEDFEFGILECADPEELPDGTVRGRIRATGFATRGMPLIRYEVGDTGVWDRRPCRCGRQSACLTRIDGRNEDFVTTPEGGRILRFDYIFKDAKNVREAQVVQRQPGRIVIRIVRRSGYVGADEDALRDEVTRRVSQGLGVDFEYVTAIEREPNGKFRAVKNELGRTNPAGGPETERGTKA